MFAGATWSGYSPYKRGRKSGLNHPEPSDQILKKSFDRRRKPEFSLLSTGSRELSSEMSTGCACIFTRQFLVPYLSSIRTDRALTIIRPTGTLALHFCCCCLSRPGGWLLVLRGGQTNGRTDRRTRALRKGNSLWKRALFCNVGPIRPHVTIRGACWNVGNAVNRRL